MAAHGKLVRDGIPEIIRANGGNPTTRILADDRAYDAALRAKVVEEAREARSADTRDALLSELADMREAGDALAALHGIGAAEISLARERKLRERGGFGGRTFLVDDGCVP